MHLFRIFTLVIALLPTLLFADTYPEVVFDNSIVNGAYAKSRVSYQGNSWVENVNKHLLISDTLFFTPGNALSLKYLSQAEGHWETTVNYSRQKFNYTLDEGDFLSIRMYVHSPHTKMQDLPKIFVQQHRYVSDTLSIAPYISKLEHKKWIQIKIPIKQFKKLSKQAPIIGIGFAQNAASSKYHQLFIDQIEFLPLKYSEIPLRSAAVLSEAKAYDKTVNLSWQLPLTPSIRYIKIYRSTDGKAFTPVGIRPIHMQSCLDMVPLVGAKYYYKITWVDYNYNESPASAVREVQTSALPEDEILKLVQLANVNYFVENFDINSGMYLPYRSKNKVIVSTKETAGAILSLIVGVQNEFVNRQTALNRISKITFFLLKSQHKHGIFAAYYDARKSIPEYRNELAIYDVQATGAILEALLIARQYFKEDNEAEKDLRTRITQVYERVNWQAIANSDNLLRSKLALLDDNDINNVPLSNLDEAINTYLLAAGHPKFALPSSAYFDAVYHQVKKIKQDTSVTINPYYYDETIQIDDFRELKSSASKDTLVNLSVFDTVYRYGMELPFGELQNSLLKLYRPFLTVRPTLISDSLVNWEQVLHNYMHFVKRRDNELGVGANSSNIWGYYQQRDGGDASYRINPAIGPASIIVDKNVGIKSLLSLYQQYGPILFTEFGFRGWLDLRNDDVSDEYISTNQAAIAIMIENARTGLIWELYESIPELLQSRQILFGNKSR